MIGVRARFYRGTDDTSLKVVHTVEQKVVRLFAIAVDIRTPATVTRDLLRGLRSGVHGLRVDGKRAWGEQGQLHEVSRG